MAAKRRRDVASYEEALEILSIKAREGDVRAAIALAGHLRKENTVYGEDDERSKIIRLAAAQSARAR